MRPEEIRLGGRRRQSHGSVRAHEPRREQAVDREAVLATDPALAAAQREAGDSGFRDDAAGNDQARALRLAVDIAPEGSALHAYHASLRIEVYAAHAGEIDHHSAIAARVTGDRVAAAPHRDQQLVLAREVHGIHDIGGAGAADEQRRPPRMHRVEDRLIRVAGVGRGQHVSPDPGLQSSERIVVDARLPTVLGSNRRRHRGLLPASDGEADRWGVSVVGRY